MKRLTILALCLALCLTACEQAEPAECALTPEQMAAAALEGQSGLPPLYAICPEDAGYTENLPLYLSELSASVEDGVLCCPFGVNATEVVIFRFADAQTAQSAEEPLRAYLDSRVSTFLGYAPEQAAVAEQGEIVVHGRYAALLICPDAPAAKDAFLRCFSQTPPAVEPTFADPPGAAEPPEPSPSESYDHDAVLAAWQSGGDGDLTGKNLAVLQAARDALSTLIVDGMTDYEKEHAVHDWLTEWGDYDPGALTEGRDEAPDPDNDNPYGLLLHKKAICSGYSSTFQLFMDMLEIPCITVQGGTGWGAEHAWNMVRLDGAWYCVDLTWDDPVDLPPSHEFLNVTSAYMYETEHVWDAEGVPVADADTYAWHGED